MDNERKQFCDRAIATTEGCIETLLSWINNDGTPEQDVKESTAIMLLIRARAALLAEQAAYECENQ